MTASPHPPPETLLAFYRGQAAGDTSAEIISHLEDCPACVARLGALTAGEADDPLIAGLRSAVRSGPSPPGAAPPVAAGEPDVPGYRVLREVGRGGMGVVYEAESVALGRRVAVKLLRDGARARPDELARFRSEALALGRLQHPNVVQVFETGTAAGMPFVVIEYVAGGTLGDALRAGPPSPREAARLAVALARGAQAAHEAGIVHRDLKPSNVLMHTGPDRAPVPKITDFGLAKLSEAAAGVTVSGSIAGTPQYMSPEQASGSGLPSPSMDVYALGAILFELLAGRPPFTGASILEVLQQVRDVPPVSPGRLRKVPADLATICLKCLRKEPAGRYASAAALADDLERFLDGRPIHARPIGPAARVAKWVRRNPAPAVLAAGLAAAVVAGVIGIAIQVVRTEDARQLAERERQKSQNLAAEQALDQGILLCESGDPEKGLALFARAHEVSAGTDPLLDFVIDANRATWGGRRIVTRRMPVFGTAVTAVAFSPDGRTVLTGDWGNRWGSPGPGRAELWAVDDLTRPRLSVEHPGNVWCVAFHPTGRAFVTGGTDGTVRTWDAATGAALGEPLQHAGPIAAVAFNPAGDRLAVAASSAGPVETMTNEVRVWDWAARAPAVPPTPTHFAVRSVAWHPTAPLVALAGVADYTRAEGRTGSAAVLDAAAGALRPGAMTQAEPMRAVAWHPDGWLATGGDDGTVRFWQADGSRRPGLLRHPLRVNAVRFARGGRMLVTACGVHHPNNPLDGPGEIQCWDVDTLERLGGPLGEKRFSVCNKINDVAVTADGRRLAAAGENGLGWVSDLPPPPVTTALATATLSGTATEAEFSPDGRQIAAWVSADQGNDRDGKPGEVVGFDARTLARTAALPVARRRVPRFHPDGTRLLAVPGDPASEVQIWAMPGGAEQDRPAGLREPMRWADWSDDGAELWTLDAADRLHRWAARDLTELAPPVEVGRPVVLFSTANPLVVAERNGEATVWFPRQDRRVVLAMPPAAAAALSRGCVYDGGRVLVTACRLGEGRTELQSWDTRTGQSLAGPVVIEREARAHPSGDDRVMVLVSNGHRADEYNLADPRTLVALSPVVTHNVLRDFHPGGRYFATASGVFSDRARLVSYTGRTIGPPVPHPDSVYLVRFSPTGDTLLTSGADKTLRLWPMP